MRRNLLSIALLGLVALFPPAARAATFVDDVDGLSQKQFGETMEFAFGNALFFVFHEAGHMLVSEFNLPVLGREEDAADTLSTLLLLDRDANVFDTALNSSVDGWILSAKAREEAQTQQILWDAHALDQQRAFNMVCMMVGRDAGKFQAAADSLGFPKTRRQECIGEFRKAHSSWFGLLKPYERTGTQKTKFTINYRKATSPQMKDYADLVKQSQLLDIVSTLLSNLYKLNDGITLTAAECGQPNAYWSPEKRELTYCYELMQEQTQVYAKHIRGVQQVSTGTDDDSSGESATMGGGGAGDDEDEQAQRRVHNSVLGSATARAPAIGNINRQHPGPAHGRIRMP